MRYLFTGYQSGKRAENFDIKTIECVKEQTIF